jgi:hypothetical protein
VTLFWTRRVRLPSRSYWYDVRPAARPVPPVSRCRASYVKLWVLVPASPVIPVSERPSEVTLPARSNAWDSEPGVPRLIEVGRLAGRLGGVPTQDLARE